MTSNTPYDDIKQTALYSREQVINVLDGHIADLELHLGEMPNPKDPINGRKYIRWERYGMSWIGEVKGSLEMAKLVGLITAEQYQRLKLRAYAAITRLTAKMVMEGPR